MVSILFFFWPLRPDPVFWIGFAVIGYHEAVSVPPFPSTPMHSSG